MGNHKKYWKSEVELSSDKQMITDLKNNEFAEQLPTDLFVENKNILQNSNTNRRDFLKYLGFSTAAATLASCEGPVNRSIPYVVQPERIIPGISNFYATSIADGFDFANVLIKTREGRPIKIENNSKAKVKSSANARVQASVLSMYDSLRIKGPTKDGQDISWNQFNQTIISELESLKDSNSEVVLLTQTFASPSTEKIIKDYNKEAYDWGRANNTFKDVSGDKFEWNDGLGLTYDSKQYDNLPPDVQQVRVGGKQVLLRDKGDGTFEMVEEVDLNTNVNSQGTMTKYNQQPVIISEQITIDTVKEKLGNKYQQQRDMLEVKFPITDGNYKDAAAYEKFIDAEMIKIAQLIN